MNTYISTSEITTLSHKALDYTMELGTSVAKSIYTCAKFKEVLRGKRCRLLKEVEVDATPFLHFATR